jgi:xanthine dehydrogenase accessory factor
MSVLGAVRKLVESEQLGAICTIVSGPGTGTKAVIDIDAGYVAGELPAEIAEAVHADAVALMTNEQSRTLGYGENEVYIETVAPQPILLVFGAGHISQPLYRMAQEIGFKVVVSDAREMWATTERFADVDELIIGWPDDVFARYEPDRRTYVVLLSHDARFEDPVMPKVRNAPVRYIGAMGSRRTHRDRVARLQGMGWTDEETARVHGPVGLDLGAETPAEMAIAILAEIIQIRYGHGSGLSLRGREGRIHIQRGEEDGTA